MQKTGQPTINDVARIAGVSKKTVSRVINKSPLLNGDTRLRVETVIADIGYIPNPQARALALRRNYLVGLVHDNPNAQTVMNVQRGMLEGLQGTEFELVVRPLNRGAQSMLSDLRYFLERQRLFGVLLMPPISENESIVQLCREIGCRYVRMCSVSLDDDAHMVASNDREAVRGAVAYLIEQGHRRIGLIAGPQGFRSATERRAGFEDALREAGLPLQRSLIAGGDYTFESGLVAAERLLDLTPRPTAIFSSSDTMAAGVMHAARARGLDIPRDLSIIGFDDTPVAAHVWPPLTTVRWPTVSMGRSAALKLISGVGEEEELVEEPSLFISTLIRRGSVAPPID
ncbi:LacI family DNA-binding transcriptional regulator [Sphingomonas sp. BIUV-7]|uniref:LacI family DNA-binding transcriptional regulator n=1 Tax=Sphingomonas natans TaxID=3063330 RepID=A0ABT8Y4V1_9SPHN|nr:LacI family DNA-binding transcriptional regulator [Sphingomonas sp. BIUV-7]MDO6413350.1 LacI family DNA-binding transcriptional regulator [Sphingomonas sp. BIUV-7]